MTEFVHDFDRILIIATRQIGDVLCTTPLIGRARELWPRATIHVLGYEKTTGMLVGNSAIDEIIESPEHPTSSGYWALLKKIYRKYDLAIITQPSDRAHIYGIIAAGKRIGIVPNNPAHNWWKKCLSMYSVELDYWRQHVVVERLRLLSPFDGQKATVEPKPLVTVTPPSPKELPEDLEDFLHSGATIVMHATPMWNFKRWPIKNWAELVIHHIRLGRNVVLTGSASRQDRDLNKQIIRQVEVSAPKSLLTHVRDYAGRLSLGQTAGLLKRAELYLGVDTSVTHLAAACGIRTVALFGPTAPSNFGPWPASASCSEDMQSIWALQGAERPGGVRRQTIGNVTIIQGPGHCVPCRKAGCLDKFESHSDCLENLSVAAVTTTLSDAS